MQLQPLRLPAGLELRAALQELVEREHPRGAFVVCGIGSLDGAALRFAAQAEPTELPGPWEILTLSGSLSRDGLHLHLTIADAQGRVLGGHLSPGNRIRTTVELLLAPMTDLTLGRHWDPATGFKELLLQASPRADPSRPRTPPPASS